MKVKMEKQINKFIQTAIQKPKIMKNYFCSLFAIILLAGTSCQQEIDVEIEKAAIKAVIEGESNAAWAKDFDKQSGFFVQDESLLRLSADKNSFACREGWTQISSIYRGYYSRNPKPSTNKWEFSNYKIKVYKESAWAVYDAIWRDANGNFLAKHKSVRFLEKAEDKWKIVYMSWIDETSYYSGVDFTIFDK